MWHTAGVLPDDHTYICRIRCRAQLTRDIHTGPASSQMAPGDPNPLWLLPPASSQELPAVPSAPGLVRHPARLGRLRLPAQPQHPHPAMMATRPVKGLGRPLCIPATAIAKRRDWALMSLVAIIETLFFRLKTK
jgi:hypothetical protein